VGVIKRVLVSGPVLAANSIPISVEIVLIDKPNEDRSLDVRTIDVTRRSPIEVEVIELSEAS